MKVRTLLGLMAIPMLLASASAEVESIVETFRGQGAYDGLDNPGWTIRVEGGEGELTERGYAFDVDAAGLIEVAGVLLKRDVEGIGSFIQRLVIRDLTLPEIDMFNTPLIARITASNILGGPSEVRGFTWILEDAVETEDPYWEFTAFDGHHFPPVTATVRRGTNISIESRYDHRLKTITFYYDHDIDDNEPASQTAKLDYTGGFDSPQVAHLVVATELADSPVIATFAEYSIWPFSSLLGDFNLNEVLDVGDINQLQLAIDTGLQSPTFDVNEDGTVNLLDQRTWVQQLKGTWLGDANLDGEFTSADFVQVFLAGGYEDEQENNSSWATGDWNADREFTSQDFTAAFLDGGYEAGPRAAVSPIPEPAGAILLLAGAMMLAAHCRHHRPRASCDR